MGDIKIPAVVITGGNKGIGRSIADAFIAAGCHVVIGSRSDDGLEDFDTEHYSHIKMDVRDEAAHVALCDRAIEVGGKLHAYVNNVGISAWRPIGKIDDAFFDELMAVNLKGAVWGCKAAAAAMERTGGVIINISSMAAKRGSANNAMYCATKFGMNGLTQSLCKELGGHNIRVNALCPVLVKTEGLMRALREDHAPGVDGAEIFLENFIGANAALGRLPTAADVGNMAVFLASAAASGITGQCINVDCGVFPQ
jgi:NAD(P)-dependent dehydrogenase (short-subunit alcohol dehydrogenase family)